MLLHRQKQTALAPSATARLTRPLRTNISRSESKRMLFSCSLQVRADYGWRCIQNTPDTLQDHQHQNTMVSYGNVPLDRCNLCITWIYHLDAKNNHIIIILQVFWRTILMVQHLFLLEQPQAIECEPP